MTRPSSAVSLVASEKQRSLRPSSAVPGWPGAAGGQRVWRPGSAAAGGRSRQPLFSPAFQDKLGNANRFMKDMEASCDIEGRSLRYDSLSLKRQTASTGQLLGTEYGKRVEFGCPLARGPLGDKLREEVQVRPQSASWHKKKVRQMYKHLDPQQAGAVRLEQLRGSFEALSVPIDDETFGRYASDLLHCSPQEPDSAVHKGAFLNFHEEVWANQPGVVRRHAGDPTENGDALDAVAERTSDNTIRAGAMMQRSASVPAGASIGELRNNETMLRKTFLKHADERSAKLTCEKIPAILQDLGLPGTLPDILATADREVQTMDFEDALSFHETVSIVNKCIATHEASRDYTSMSSKLGERLGAALIYSTQMGHVVDSSEEETILRDRGKNALESEPSSDDDGAVLPIDDEEEASRDKARRSIEAALLGTKSEPFLGTTALLGTHRSVESPRDKARRSIEAALLGTTFVPSEESPRDKARRSIEAALLGTTSVPSEESPRDKARRSIEAALLGTASLPSEESPRDKARRSIEIALLGTSAIPTAESPRSNARRSLEAALLGCQISGDSELEASRAMAKIALAKSIEAAITRLEPVTRLCGDTPRTRVRTSIESALLEIREPTLLAKAAHVVEVAVLSGKLNNNADDDNADDADVVSRAQASLEAALEECEGVEGAAAEVGARAQDALLSMLQGELDNANGVTN